jgi:hypothetical protein
MKNYVASDEGLGGIGVVVAQLIHSPIVWVDGYPVAGIGDRENSGLKHLQLIGIDFIEG